MTTSLRFALLSLAILFAGRVSASVPLVNLVDEQSPLVISVQDMPALIKNWNQSPWAKTWNDEQMKKFLAPLRGQMKVDQWDESSKAETGYTVGELLAMAKGQVLVALTSADLPWDEDDPEPAKFPILLAIELGDNAAKVAKIIAESDEKDHSTVHTEDFAGVKLHIYQKPADQGGEDEFVWAMTEGIWMLGPSKATIQKSIDCLQKGRAEAPLGESERYLKIKKQHPDANVTFILNIQTLYPGIKSLVEKQAEHSGAQPMGVPPGILMDAFGLNTLRDLYLSVEVGENATTLSGGLTYSEARGLFKMLAYRDGPVAQPAFVSEKWITASTVNFSVPDAYAGLKDFLQSFNPTIANVAQAKIKELNQQLGVDLERDLIGSVGANIVAANALRPGASADTPAPLTEMDQLYAIALVNPVSFTKAVEAIKGLIGPQADKLFEKREYLGQTIFTMAMPNQQPGQTGFSYAITPQYVFIAAGSAAVIETALQGLDGKHPSLWQKPDVKASLADVPALASGFDYQDTHAMFGCILETFLQIAPGLFGTPAKAEKSDDSEQAGDENEHDSSLFDFSARPKPADLAKYWNTSAGYVWRDSQGFYLNSKINHAK